MEASYTPPSLADDRRLFRRVTLERVRDRAADVAQPVDSFTDNLTLEVIPLGVLGGLLADVGAETLPDFDRQTAEVTTPARVTVWAACPRCGIAAPIVAAISALLEVTDSSAEVKLKAKAKARSHVCGQMPLPEADQQTMNLGVLDGYVLEARALTDEEGLAEIVPPAPYAVCGATAHVEVASAIVDGATAEFDVVCALVAGHSVTEALGSEWERAHVDRDQAIAWRYAPVAADDAEDVVEAEPEDGSPEPAD